MDDRMPKETRENIEAFVEDYIPLGLEEYATTLFNLAFKEGVVIGKEEHGAKIASDAFRSRLREHMEEHNG